MTKWISAEDKFPESITKEYWFYDGDEIFCDSLMCDGGEISYPKNNITHWAEIEYPEPPLPEIKPCPVCQCCDTESDNNKIEICLFCENKECNFYISKQGNDMAQLINIWNSIERSEDDEI